MHSPPSLTTVPAPAELAVAAILEPLARLMIDHGVQHGQVAEMLKRALVQESTGRYGVGDREVSDTRVALLTGVHRKDVRRLRMDPEDARAPKAATTIPAAVVARWISDPRFLTIDQRPRALARSPKLGVVGEPDFPALVAEVSRDLSSRSVLDELVRTGAVEIDPQGQVALMDQAFVPHNSPGEQFEFLATNVGDHLSAAVHNLTPQRAAAPMLEQSAFSEALSTEQALALHGYARKLWSTALQKFLMAATVAEERSKNAPHHEHRVRFGMYFYDQSPDPSGQSVSAAHGMQKDSKA